MGTTYLTSLCRFLDSWALKDCEATDYAKGVAVSVKAVIHTNPTWLFSLVGQISQHQAAADNIRLPRSYGQDASLESVQFCDRPVKVVLPSDGPM